MMLADYSGAKSAFASDGNLACFLHDPAAFAPQYDGHCAYGVAPGGKVPANPNLWRIVDGKLYLNISEKVVRYWEDDIPGYLDEAASSWPELEPEKASSDEIPDFNFGTHVLK